jgi:hypothetical protein
MEKVYRLGIEISDDVLLTPHDLAYITGFGYKKTLELMKSSGFPRLKIGAEYRVNGKAYKKWVDQNCGKKITM